MRCPRTGLPMLPCIDTVQIWGTLRAPSYTTSPGPGYPLNRGSQDGIPVAKGWGTVLPVRFDVSHDEKLRGAQVDSFLSCGQGSRGSLLCAHPLQRDHCRDHITRATVWAQFAGDSQRGSNRAMAEVSCPQYLVSFVCNRLVRHVYFWLASYCEASLLYISLVSDLYVHDLRYDTYGAGMTCIFPMISDHENKCSFMGYINFWAWVYS